MVDLLESFRLGIRPIPKLTCWQWADANRILTSESSAEKGSWSTARIPHMYQIMEDLSPTSPVQEVIVMKGAQLGFTETAMNVIGTFIDIDPCPILYVMPNLMDAKKISKKRLDPMIKNSPTLSKKIRPARERDSNNNVLSKMFSGGSVDLVGAESPSGLASQSIRVMVLDEVDRYPLDIGGQGSPIYQAKERCSTFPNRKILMISTPTTKGKSAIAHELSTTDWNERYVPCPECGALQILKFSQLKWEPGKPDTAKYYCEHAECGKHIEERFKTTMFAKGVWMPRHPENASPFRKGYHISSFYSAFGWLSWVEIAHKYENALAKQKEDPSLMKVFVNTTLGEPYEETGEAPPYNNLYNRREKYPPGHIPADVCFLTAGIDVQKGRVEMEIVGWSVGRTSFSINYIVVPGDIDNKETADKLYAHIIQNYIREDKAELPILMTAIDTGYNTTEVYAFCRRFSGTQVVPVKGGPDSQITILTTPKKLDVNHRGRKVGVISLWNIGVGKLKSELYNYLSYEKEEDGSIPHGYCFFPEYDLEHFKRLTAEALVIELVNGKQKQHWKKIYERNEQLDCRVYARAAAEIVGISRFTEEEFLSIRNSYLSRTMNKPKERKKSGFWDRGE